MLRSCSTSNCCSLRASCSYLVQILPTWCRSNAAAFEGVALAAAAPTPAAAAAGEGRAPPTAVSEALLSGEAVAGKGSADAATEGFKKL